MNHKQKKFPFSMLVLDYPFILACWRGQYAQNCSLSITFTICLSASGWKNQLDLNFALRLGFRRFMPNKILMGVFLKPKNFVPLLIPMF
jgi:hypothetical protein